MERIVIDTNVFMAALFSKKGYAYTLVDLLASKAMNGEKYNVISVPLALELEEVLFREKNRAKYDYFSDDDLRSIVSDIIAISHHTKLHFLWRPFLKDSFDDKVLETAVNGQAHAIVTYNPKDFGGVQKHFGIEVLTPADLLQKGAFR